MSDIIESMEKEAMGLVKIVNKEYLSGKKIAYFVVLVGMGPYKVEHAGNGHNSNVVVRAIHKCYKEDSSQQYDKGFQDGLIYMAGVANKVEAMSIVLDIFFYELKLEKEGNAAFSIERGRILNHINEKLREKNEEFSQSKGYEDWIARYKKYAKEKYGILLG